MSGERAEAALRRIIQCIDHCITGDDERNTVRSGENDTEISGDLAGEIIDWVRGIADIAREGLREDQPVGTEDAA